MQPINLAPLPASNAQDLLVSICPTVKPAAADIARLCGRLPLALRLAASLLVNDDTLDLATYLHSLGDMQTRLAALHDPDEPALGVEAVLQLSYERLEPAAQVALRYLSVFTAACDHVAAAAILSPGVPDTAMRALSELRRRSMVEHDDQAPSIRLHDLVRAFAMQRLDDQERADAHQRLIQYTLALVEQAEPELIGPNQQPWFLRLEQEHEHIRAALRYARESSNTDALRRLTGAIWRFWEGRGYLTEGREWLAAALAPADGYVSDPAKALLRVKALTGAGALAQAQGQFDQARAAFEASLVLHQAYGDAKGLARALNNLGQICLHQNDLDAAERHFNQSMELLRDLDDPWIAS
jgi:tetratricopeptide (TPR) repeat protein